MPNKLSLSVVLCCYNHADQVARQLDAICNQAEHIKELILLDDGSTDASYKVMEEYKDRHKFITLLKNDSNNGVAISVNRACGVVSGDLVYFAAADDVVFPGFFKHTLEQFNMHPNAGWSCADVRFIWDDGDRICDSSLNYSIGPSFINPELLVKMSKENAFYWAPGQTVVYNYNKLKTLGFFDGKLGMWLDIYPQWILGLRHGFIYIPKLYAEAYISESCWGQQQTKNPKYLRECGEYLAKIALEQGEIRINLLRSGLLAKVVGAPSWMLGNPLYYKYIANRIYLRGILRDLIYRLPYNIRVSSLGFANKTILRFKRYFYKK